MNRNLAGFKVPHHTSIVMDRFPTASPSLLDKVEKTINDICLEGYEGPKQYPMKRPPQTEFTERSPTWREALKRRIKHDWQDHFSKARELMRSRGVTFDQNELPLELSQRVKSDKERNLTKYLKQTDSPRSIATRIALWLDQEKMNRRNDASSLSSLGSSICPAVVKAEIKNSLKESSNQKRPRRRPATPQLKFKKHKGRKCNICGKEKDSKKSQGGRKSFAANQSAKIKRIKHGKFAKHIVVPKTDYVPEEFSEADKPNSSSSMYLDIKPPPGPSKLPPTPQYSKQVFKKKPDNRKDTNRLTGGFDAFKIPPTQTVRCSKFIEIPQVDNKQVPTTSNGGYTPGKTMFLTRLQPGHDNWLEMLDKKAMEDHRLGKREIGFPWSVGRTACSRILLKEDEPIAHGPVQKPVPEPKKRLPGIRGLAKAAEILNTDIVKHGVFRADDGRLFRNSAAVNKNKSKRVNHHNRMSASPSNRARMSVVDKILGESFDKKKVAKPKSKIHPKSKETVNQEEIFAICFQPKSSPTKNRRASPKRNVQAKEVERLKGGYDDAPRLSAFRPRKTSTNFLYEQYAANRQKSSSRNTSDINTAPQQSVYHCEYCDKKFAKEHALHVHLMVKCTKIPPALKKHLNFTDLDHEPKPRVPSFPRPTKMEKKVVKYDDTPVRRYPTVEV